MAEEARTALIQYHHVYKHIACVPGRSIAHL